MSRSPGVIAASIAVPLAIALFRRYVPRDFAAESVPDDGSGLPAGAAGACMWALGLAIAAGGYFVLRTANHLFASFDRGSTLTLYPTALLWCFLPGFAALCIPWLGTLWLLRRNGYAGQAAEIVTASNEKMGSNGERIMRWCLWCIVAPIAVFTLPAIPMHLTMDHDSVRVTHYAHLSPEIFNLADARSAWFVEGYKLRDGTLQPKSDLIITFADGRGLAATAMSDGGDPAPQSFVNALLTQTKLQPSHVRTPDDIPVLR